MSAFFCFYNNQYPDFFGNGNTPVRVQDFYKREKFPMSDRCDVTENIQLALELFARKGLLEKIVRGRR